MTTLDSVLKIIAESTGMVISKSCAHHSFNSLGIHYRYKLRIFLAAESEFDVHLELEKTMSPEYLAAVIDAAIAKKRIQRTTDD